MFLKEHCKNEGILFLNRKKKGSVYVKYERIDLTRVVTNQVAPPNCDITLNIEVKSAHQGKAKGIWKVDERFINGNGVAMGGFVAGAADIMMAYALSSQLHSNQSFASIDLHTTFHRPVILGEVEVEARVERMGRNIAYVIAELQQNDKKVASVVSSVMIMTAS